MRLALALLLVPSLAHAQEPPAGPPLAPAPRPFELHDLEVGTTVGIDVGWMNLAEGEMTAWLADVVAEVKITPTVEGFVRVPTVYAVPDEDEIITNEESDGGLGNIQLGGRVVIPAGRATLAGHGSIYLPTAEDFDFIDGDYASLVGLMSTMPRDPTKFVPNATIFRPGFSARFGVAERGFVQADVSLLMLFYDDDEVETDDRNFLHLTIGAAVPLTPQTAIVAELHTFADAFDEDDEDIEGEDDDTVSSIQLGVRQEFGNASIGARLYYPIDDDMRDEDMVGINVELVTRL